MSRNQKIILGGVIIVFVIGVGLALQYVSQGNFGKNAQQRTRTTITDEGTGSRVSGGAKRVETKTEPVLEATPESVENKGEVEKALLEIESTFGEIEADTSVTE